MGNRRRTVKKYTGLKALTMIATFFATIYFSFSGANHLIHWIASGIQNHDLHALLVIVLWIFGFSIVLSLAVGFAMAIVAILARVFDL